MKKIKLGSLLLRMAYERGRGGVSACLRGRKGEEGRGEGGVRRRVETGKGRRERRKGRGVSGNREKGRGSPDGRKERAESGQRKWKR